MNERELLRRQICGEDSHVHLLVALEGVELETAGTALPGTPYTIFQILNHMIFWQEVVLERIAGRPPARPATAADGWPGKPAPSDAQAWNALVDRLATGLQTLETYSVDPELDLDRISEQERRRTVRQEIFMAAGHNSYHLGQIALLRRQLQSWPPPQGGDTW
jgi:uncharacterized damage-inducible protein DinB